MKTVRFLEGMVEIAQGFAGISEKYLTVPTIYSGTRAAI